MDPHPTLARTATNASSIHSQAHMQGFSGRPNFPYPNGMTRTEQQPASSPSTPANNTMIKPDNNIINRKAGRDQSLYHICLNLRQRLGEVPGLAEDLKTIEEQEQDEEEMDPVTKMWKYLRRGYPLVMLYNALDPAQPIDVDPSKVAESKMGKARTFKFLQACMNELKFSPADCFLITDLYEENTTGFVKVTKVVNRVLDKLSEEGRLYESSEPVQVNIGQLSAPLKKTAAGHVIQELIDTERDYLQHLETLQAFKKELEESGSVPGDIIHNIFLNLNALLDFAQRFLIKIELHCEVPMEQQNWGRVFAQYAESFSVYEPFIANEQTRQKTLNDEWDKIQAAGQISSEFQQMVSVPSILSGFLLKPFQRLAKYPLLLKELRTKGKLSEDLQADLLAGEEAMQTILRRANRILEKQELQNSLTDLDVRVDDWKGHKLEHFGDLLLCGPFTVVKSDGVGKDVEREVRNHFDSHAFDQKQWFRDIFVSENGQPELVRFNHPYLPLGVSGTVVKSQLPSTCKIFEPMDSSQEMIKHAKPPACDSSQIALPFPYLPKKSYLSLLSVSDSSGEKSGPRKNSGIPMGPRIVNSSPSTDPFIIPSERPSHVLDGSVIQASVKSSTSTMSLRSPTS
ncbi:MAG: hypothetical protein M1834_002929 [Cirrosporium novae-zelandiae]|nr:MAG: hypothetical protein M1834_002929 [Cirrosporium novae-zelandiae]